MRTHLTAICILGLLGLTTTACSDEGPSDAAYASSESSEGAEMMPSDDSESANNADPSMEPPGTDVPPATDTEATAHFDQGASAPEPRPTVTVVEYAVAPVDVVGQAVKGEAEITEVISDRGFYLKAGGGKVLAVVREDTPRHEMIKLREGQTISFTGLALERSMWNDLTGTIEPALKQALQSEPAFIAMYWKDVEIKGENM